MRARRLAPFLAAFFLASAASGCRPGAAARSVDAGTDSLLFSDCSDGPFADQGPFVEVPARVGFVVFGVGGVVLAAWEGHHRFDKWPFEVCGDVGYFTVGGSFWAIKVIAWDLPGGLIRQAQPREMEAADQAPDPKGARIRATPAKPSPPGGQAR
jgi:hypothetical protein